MEEMLNFIAKTYGIRGQVKKLNEEVFELTEAILSDDFSQENITEEFADVMVLMEQIRILCGINPDKVKEWMEFKCKRQVMRIHYKNGGGS